MKKSYYLLPFYLIILLINACSSDNKQVQDEIIIPEEVLNLDTFFTKYKVQGSFILYDMTQNEYTLHNAPQLDSAFTPASTFKICNSLIALETGIVSDQNFVIAWDSVSRQKPEWNQDNDLKMAFSNSTVWYYQEVARRIGEEKMKYWLDTLNYGNKNSSGGISQFWLDGGLRITPNEQCNFLLRLIKNELPISQQSMDIVKEIMTIDKNESGILKGKTGWGFMDNKDIGWFIGWVEKESDSYIFVNCIQSDNPENMDFGRARTEIVMEILAAMEIYKNP